MNIKIASAVAAALALTAPAFALDPTGTVGAEVQLTVSGASAARDAFGALMANTICTSGFSMYRANPTGGHDFRAYSCTLSGDGALGGAAGKTATVYYRAEGGSAWGPVPLAVGVSVVRLQVNSDCTLNASTVSLPGVAAGVQTYNCPTAGYSLANDNVPAGENNLVKDTVDLAVADEEPKMYGAPNFPQSTVFPNQTSTQRQNLLNALNASAVVGFGQTFGIIVNSAGSGTPGNGAAGTVATPFPAFSSSSGTQPVLSKQAIAGIFNGTFTDWNQVPTLSGGKVLSAGSLKIRVCRREQGSGTQVGANQYFLGVTQCGATLGSFVVDVASDNDITAATVNNDTNGVIEMGTSGDLNTCVATLAGSIGIAVGNAPATGTNFVSINGMGFPNRNAAAIGNYDYWYEQTFTVNPDLSAGDPLDLANGMITLSSEAAKSPNVLSVIALPNASNDPYSQGAFVGTQPPVAFGTRGGNSCAAPGPVSQ